MVTPIGNPQNLYLYTSGRLTALDFLTLLAPYAAVALALLLALCLLLSPFTQDAKALALGVDLGGLGTLIASLASLISFRLYGAGEGVQKGRYFAVFTGVNVLFLAVMLFLTAIL